MRRKRHRSIAHTTEIMYSHTTRAVPPFQVALHEFVGKEDALLRKLDPAFERKDEGVAVEPVPLGHTRRLRNDEIKGHTHTYNTPVPVRALLLLQLILLMSVVCVLLHQQQQHCLYH